MGLRDDGSVTYHLVLPGHFYEVRARLRGFLDAVRDVRSPACELPPRFAGGEQQVDSDCLPRADADGSPPFCRQVAGWSTSRASAIGGRAQEEIGPLSGKIERLRALIAEGLQGHEGAVERLAEAASTASLSDAREAPGHRAASRPAAQARRRERLVAQAEGVARGRLASLQADLAEALAERAAVAGRYRAIARQVVASGDSVQAIYWAERLTWTRRRQRPLPVPVYCRLPLPAWMTEDAALYEGQPEPDRPTSAADEGEA